MAEVRDKFGMKIVTEAIDNESLDLVEKYADVIQIGARNMQNFSLLKRAGRARKPVLLKRGMSATLEELLMAAEYVMSEGNYNVILCERGVRTFADHTRNTLDLSIVPAVQRLSHLPIVVDPSHGTGKRNKVTPLSRAAIAVGADGLIVEVHHEPDRAMSDGIQSLYPEQFDELMKQVRQIAPVVGRMVPAIGNHRRAAETAAGAAGVASVDQSISLRKFLLLAVAASGGRRYWLVVSSASASCPAYGPAYREYAYVTNGKSNTVSVIDLRTFQPARTIRVGNEPTGIAANGKKNEVYVVNTQSNSISVIDAERNEVVATIGVHAAPISSTCLSDGKRALCREFEICECLRPRSGQAAGAGEYPGGRFARTGAGFAGWFNGGGQQSGRQYSLVDRRRATEGAQHNSCLPGARRHRYTARQQQSIRGLRRFRAGCIHRFENRQAAGLAGRGQDTGRPGAQA